MPVSHGCYIGYAIHRTNLRIRAIRFFHRMSEVPPYQSNFPLLEAPNVTPQAFERTWEERVNEWGAFMRQS